MTAPLISVSKIIKFIWRTVPIMNYINAEFLNKLFLLIAFLHIKISS